MPSKRCNKCGETKDVSEFYKRAASKDGFQYKCKACSRECCRQYRQDNAETVAEKKRQWREDNAEAIKEYSRRYHHDNVDAKRERMRRWREDNPERAAAHSQKRRARKAGVPSDGVPVDITDQPCYVCGAAAEAVDHVIPIAKGGPDTVDNKMPICKSCNSAKGAHIWPDKPGWDEFVHRRRNQND